MAVRAAVLPLNTGIRSEQIIGRVVGIAGKVANISDVGVDRVAGRRRAGARRLDVPKGVEQAADGDEAVQTKAHPFACFIEADLLTRRG